MLETVRQYGVERLDEAGELDAMRDRHRDGLLAVAEHIAPAFTAPASADGSTPSTTRPPTSPPRSIVPSRAMGTRCASAWL
jgi:predicted ATPase